ncbi:kinase-like protein [Gigaspora margarita]|uniref:Kinase-like protein n=1 Tax=Gigaspora margarita TaxID=4874 RepID=A0A8H4B1G3_GIGMA|nr:kinase-like protein [Gigaspora margarita]
MEFNKRDYIYRVPSVFEVKGGSANEIQMLIFEGKRETPVNGTPNQYVELYTLSWDDSPEERPDIKKVLEVLNMLFVNHSQNLLPQYLL